MKIEIVEINRNGIKVKINKSDFDPKKHELWNSKKPETKRGRQSKEQ